MSHLTWVREGDLARSCRPGYASREVSAKDVDVWLSQVKVMGVRTIICLLGPDQLGYYDALPRGLPAYYKANGFNVEHIPVVDYRSPPLTEEQLELVWRAYQDAPKPVLIHCSAGVDRTGAALEHILDSLEAM